ncbi:AAA family ATPase [Kitasatospora purpeofusca]|uniref:AAA family ATPase n=1 Tax=Kitasatospora purpeofusca TaxID=67352 RepID=UPI0036F03B93
MWRGLDDAGTRFLRGQLVLVAAGPGTGKSALVLAYALQAGVPVLYFSADSDAFVQLARSISILTGRTMRESIRAVRDDDMEVMAELPGRPVRMIYDASPDLSTIEASIESWEEVFGEYPFLVVIDNITNVRSAGEGNADDPFKGLESLMDYLHTMARATMACVIGLHHVTGAYNDADKPIPLSGVKGQIGRVPEMILTLHKIEGIPGVESDKLCVSTVKNRGGRADPSGQTFVELEFDGDRMRIADPV